MWLKSWEKGLDFINLILFLKLIICINLIVLGRCILTWWTFWRKRTCTLLLWLIIIFNIRILFRYSSNISWFFNIMEIITLCFNLSWHIYIVSLRLDCISICTWRITISWISLVIKYDRRFGYVGLQSRLKYFFRLRFNRSFGKRMNIWMVICTPRMWRLWIFFREFCIHK